MRLHPCHPSLATAGRMGCRGGYPPSPRLWAAASTWESSSRLRRDVGEDDDDGEAHVAVAGWAPRPRSRPRRVPVERVSAPAHDSLKLCMMPQ
jgi:hypothetical protein